MSEHTYKKIELTGSSPNSADEAIRNAIAKAAASVAHMEWFEVVDTRGNLEANRIAHWQVTVKVGFRLND